MKRLALLAVAALAGCAGPPRVLELGSGRYRVTQDGEYTPSAAEARAVSRANAYCAAQGKRADIALTSQAAGAASYASASADFTCR